MPHSMLRSSGCPRRRRGAEAQRIFFKTKFLYRLAVRPVAQGFSPASRISGLFVILVLVATQFGCAESYFDLAADSRLPTWFKVPAPLTRGDVAVRMTYYVLPNGRTASFVLRDKSGKKLSSASGTLEGLAPRTLGSKIEDAPFKYPGFEIITVNGITEVIEHRSYSTVFYIVDDPVVKRAIGAP